MLKNVSRKKPKSITISKKAKDVKKEVIATAKAARDSQKTKEVAEHTQKVANKASPMKTNDKVVKEHKQAIEKKADVAKETTTKAQASAEKKEVVATETPIKTKDI